MLVETSWTWRRLASLLSLAAAWVLFAFIVVSGRDTGVARDALGILAMVILGVLGLYTGAATWDDRNRMVHGRVESPPPVPPSVDDAPVRNRGPEQ